MVARTRAAQLAAETTIAMTQNALTDLSSDELDQVAGGFFAFEEIEEAR